MFKIILKVGSIDKSEIAKYYISEPSDIQIFRRIGCKRYGLGRLIRQALPNGKIYIEPFSGTFAIGKDLADRYDTRIYNDIDPYGLLLIKELSLGHASKMLLLLEAVEYSPRYLKLCLSEFQAEKDPLRKAVYAWVILTQSRGGNCRHWNFVTGDREHLRYIYNLDARFKLASLFEGVKVYSKDAIDLIKEYDAPDVVMYIDPPYILYNNNVNRIYCQNWGIDLQLRLLEALKNIRHAKVLLSGYSNGLYDSTLYDWSKYSINELSKLIDNCEYTLFPLEVVWSNYKVGNADKI